MENTTNLTIKTLNPNNEYNLDLQAFLDTGVTYHIGEFEDDDTPNNIIILTKIPAWEQIYHCLNTNLHNLYQRLADAGGDDDWDDYIPSYLTEITCLLSGLYHNNLITWNQAKEFLIPIIGTLTIIGDIFIATELLTGGDPKMQGYLENCLYK